jgi:hypothetical protein
MKMARIGSNGRRWPKIGELIVSRESRFLPTIVKGGVLTFLPNASATFLAGTCGELAVL